MTADVTGHPRHVPVLRERVVELLAPALAEPGTVYVDATVGLGGHAEAVLQRLPHTRVVGLDRDSEALNLASQRLQRFADRVTLVHAVYDEFARVVDALGIGSVDAALFDLGVSSVQIDQIDRGFAYAVDAPLDMRMDQTHGRTAADVLNTYPADRLERVLSEYGEERYARRISRAVVAERAKEPFSRSARLVELLARVVPAGAGRRGGHPAKRTFQALRIEVNGELDSFRTALPGAVGTLRVGGRIAVLSYHSLEDRITKAMFAAGASSRTPPELPVELPQHAAYLRLLTRGAERPTSGEIESNPRAASARLRAAERVRETTPGERR